MEHQLIQHLQNFFFSNDKLSCWNMDPTLRRLFLQIYRNIALQQLYHFIVICLRLSCSEVHIQTLLIIFLQLNLYQSKGDQ